MRTSITLLTLVPAAVFALSVPAEAVKRRVPKDYATIQDAIDVAVPGDVVEISKGVYFEDISLSGKNDLTVRARSGHKVVIDGGGSLAACNVMHSSGVLLHRLRLRNANYALLGQHADDVLVESCRLTGSEISAYLVSCENFVMRACRALGAETYGVFAVSGRYVFEGNVIRGAGEDGLYLASSEACTITGNEIEDVGGHGIELSVVSPCTDVLVIGNSIDTTGKDGILIPNGSSNVSVLENVIVDTAHDGIEIWSDAAVVVDKNVVRNAGLQGIELYTPHGLVCRNTAKNCKDGFDFGLGAAGCLVTKNKAIKSQRYGFHVTEPDSTFTGNVSKKTLGVGLFDEEAPGANAYFDNAFDSIAP